MTVLGAAPERSGKAMMGKEMVKMALQGAVFVGNKRARVTRCQLKSLNEHLQSIHTSIVGRNVSFESYALKPISK